MRRILLIGMILGIFSILSKSGMAYLDPGTGSVIAGSLWPLAIAFFSAILAFLVKYFWSPIKNTIFGAKKIEEKPEREPEK